MYGAVQECAEALRGKLIAAAATPLREDRTSDRSVTASYLSSLMASGADGLAVGVHTGRGSELDPVQRRELVEIARSVSPIVVTSVSEHEHGNERDWPRIAADAGATALLLLHDPTCDTAATLRHCDRLWDETGLPLIAFDLYTNPYEPNHLSALLGHPAVAGFKPARLYDAIACQDGILAATRLGRTVLTGEDRMLGASLLWGAEAALVGIAAASVEVAAATVRLHLGGDAASFLIASSALDALAAVTFRQPWDGYVQRMLWVAADEGLIPEDMAFDPLRPSELSDRERPEVLEVARASRQSVTALLDRQRDVTGFRSQPFVGK